MSSDLCLLDLHIMPSFDFSNYLTINNAIGPKFYDEIFPF